MENQRMDSFDEMTAQIDGELELKNKKNAKKRLEQEKLERKKQFNEGLNLLAEKVLEREHDQNDTTYILLKTFLDVALEIQELMENVSAINDAMSCLNDAIGFIDAALDLDKEFLQESLEHKYGFFARLKMKRQNKKAIRNCVNRMTALADNIYMKFEMANGMAQAMAKLGIVIKKKMQKATLKAKKKAEKSGTTSSIETASTRGDKFLEKLREEKRAAGENVPTPPAPTAPSSSDGSFDDIV